MAFKIHAFLPLAKDVSSLNLEAQLRFSVAKLLPNSFLTSQSMYILDSLFCSFAKYMTNDPLPSSLVDSRFPQIIALPLFPRKKIHPVLQSTTTPFLSMHMRAYESRHLKTNIPYIPKLISARLALMEWHWLPLNPSTFCRYTITVNCG